jgi:eukaryotic-like serine/threonine-protein kinase
VQPLLSSEPTTIGDYRLLSRLGSGAMGAVYLGRSRGGRMVAVKVVRPELAGDAEFRERFRREVEMARSVGGFWTAAVVDADPDADQPWLATEYVPGPTLHKVVSEHGPLPEHTVRNLAAGLAEALGAIHRAGLVHRDLKPANVLVGPDGPRVIDFGISRATAANSLTATGMFMGTPGFFSPEQTSGEEVGPPSDVFSLGAVLAFAATGTNPFGNENTPVMLYRVVHSAPDLSRIPDGLLPLLTSCLDKNPEQRPTTADILDRVGEANPEGNLWLPPAVKAAIDEHTARLQHVMIAPDAGAPPPFATRRGSAPAPPPPWPERTAELPPARPSQPPPPEPTVGKDTPGPVFSTGGRLAALFGALVLFGIVAAVFRYDVRLYQHVAARNHVYLQFLVRFWPLVRYGVILLEIGGTLALIRAAIPALRLKIGGGGLRISRLGLSRNIPWQQVERIGIVGRGRGQAVAVWIPPHVQPPEMRWWHWVRRYHGGVRIFPIGIAGTRRRRRREVARVRLALQQYAPGIYDNRLL